MSVLSAWLRPMRRIIRPQGGMLTASASQNTYKLIHCISRYKTVKNIMPVSLHYHLRSLYTVSGIVSTMWQHFGFQTRLKYRKYILRRSALRLYLCCVELVDHDAFIQEFNMPDSFASWFRVTELHIWMCLVRLAQEGREGKVLRDFMMEYFWQDLTKKSKKLSPAVSSKVYRESIRDLSEQLKASLFSYDEGLLGSDKVLAGALWRNMFDKKCDNAEYIEAMVHYVRKQIVHLDSMDSEVLQSTGLFTFLPLHDSPEARKRNKQILVHIAKRI